LARTRTIWSEFYGAQASSLLSLQAGILRSMAKEDMKHFKTILTVVATLFALRPAQAAVDVVASLPEMAAIAREVGGNKVTVSSIAQPNTDYHAVEPRPSLVQKIAKAELVVRSGLGLDGWMDALMNAAGNSKLNKGGAGYVDASTDVPVLDLPKSSISGASGDVHPNGNPHYFYDPVYAKFAARNIVKGLIRVDAANADYYRGQLADFYKETDRHMEGWKKQLAPYNGRAVVTFHEDCEYFLRRFGLTLYGTMEPKPGIPPSAAHINRLIDGMKKDGVKAVVIESIFPTKFPDLVSRTLGVKYFVVPYSVGSMGTKTYFDLIDQMVEKTRQALAQ
jgi:zinc/manganese transport system substrate-binding protein